jgi:hypothetical protein
MTPSHRVRPCLDQDAGYAHRFDTMLESYHVGARFNEQSFSRLLSMP